MKGIRDEVLNNLTGFELHHRRAEAGAFSTWLAAEKDRMRPGRLVYRSIYGPGNYTLQIMRFGHSQQHGMIGCLPALFNNLHPPPRVNAGTGDDLEKHLFTDMVGAGAGDEDAASIH